MTGTRTLLYDLEISPILGWVYEMWDARVIKVEREPYIMSLSWKWLGESGVNNTTIQDDVDDRGVCLILWDLMNEADIVVAHNAKKFDNRVAAARFVQHEFKPPSPFKTVDTLMASRRFFRFPTNSLNDVCHRLGLGEKPKTTHAGLWHDCIGGDEKSWKKMVRYNNNDVILLERLYKRLLPYISNHPSVSVNKESGCPRCGSNKLQSRGYAHTNVSTFRRLQCQSCGSWSRERIAEPDRAKFVSIAS